MIRPALAGFCRSKARAVGLTAAVTFLLVFLLSLFPEQSFLNALIPLAFVYPALVESRMQKESLAAFGLHGRWPNADEVKIFFVAVGALLLPFILVYYFWSGLVWEKPASLTVAPALSTVLRTFAIQLLVVAFPEEFFFRGYLQRRLGEIFKSSAGFPVKSLILSNMGFALIHLLGVWSPWRLLTFFPGLIFGYLFWKTKNLFVPILFHAICNVTLFVLSGFYR